jgi:hypothetical protein
MIKFIKSLLGFGSAEPAKTQETVREILTPVVTNVAPNSAKTLEAQYIPPAKTVPTVAKKVRAITDTKPGAVAAAHAPKPGNKKRRPYRGNKVKAGGTVVKLTEGQTKGGNNTVKPAQVAKAKPVAPKAPTAKKK